MQYVVEEYFLAGIPQTRLTTALAPRGLADHWTAGRPGRAGAIATANDFAINPGRNASYHELHWWEQATRTFGVLEIVPADRAAHSMNPRQPAPGTAASAAAPYTPDAEVRRILGDRWWDPNATSYAESFAGMPADLEAAMRDAFFIACEARRSRELMARFAGSLSPRPHFNHGQAQPVDRYDWGTALTPAIYAALAAPEPVEDDEMQLIWRSVTQQWTTGVGPEKGKFWVGAEEKFFTEPEVITTFNESGEYDAQGRWSTPSATSLRKANYPDPILGPEVLVFPRSSITPIPGTRRDGLPTTAGGYTEAQLQAAIAAAVQPAEGRTATLRADAIGRLEKLRDQAGRDAAALREP